MDVAKLAKIRPDLVGQPDDIVMAALADAYPNTPPEKIAADLGLALAKPPEAGRSALDVVKDLGVSAVKGAIGVPETAVGFADMVTGGRVGKALQEGASVGGLNLRFDPQEARKVLDEQYSDPQKRAFQAVEQGDGFMGKLGAAVTNPSTIVHSVVESLPVMGAGGIAARGLLGVGARAMSAEAAAAGSMGPYAVPGTLTRALGAQTAGAAAGAAGEGITMAGQDAEQIRQSAANGQLTPEQIGYASAIGVLGGGIAMVGGMVAKKLGIADIDTMIATGRANPGAEKGIVRRVLEGMFSEGVLEELPQSVMEQVLQNKASGKPLEEGVDMAAVMGMLAGAAMGGGANIKGPIRGTKGDSKTESPSKTAPGAVLPGGAAAGGLTGTVAAPPAPPAAPPAGPGAGPLERAAATTQPGATLPTSEDLKKGVDAAVKAGEEQPMGFPAPEPVDPRAERDQQLAEQHMADYDESGAQPNEQPYPIPDSKIPDIASPIDAAAHEAATSPLNDRPEPTDAQKEAGNYKKGHVNVQGMDITVENPQGSTRSGKRPDGTEWTHTMSNHYGYIKRTEGADGEQVDVYVGPKHDAPTVWVVDQVNQHDSSFDEHKAMLGFATRGAAINAYRSNFDKGWILGRVTEMPVDQFKEWLKTGDLKQPVSPRGPLNAQGQPNATATEPQEAAGSTAQATEPAPAARPAAAAGAAAGVEAAGGEPLVQHVTGKGKTLTGYVRKISEAEAKAIDPGTFRGKNGGWFLRKDRADEFAKKQAASPDQGIVEGDASTVRTTQTSGAQGLRGQGSDGVPRVEGQLPSVRGSRGPASEQGSHAGQNQEQQGVRAGERPVGDVRGAAQEPNEQRAPDAGRSNDDPQGLGQRGGPDGRGDQVPTGSGVDGARRADDAGQRGRPDARGQNADAQGENADSDAVGKRGGSEQGNASSSSAQRVDDGAGAGDTGKAKGGVRQPSADTLRAQADLNNALADLGDLFGKPFRANIAPEQEAKLIPILTRVLDAAFRLGYHKFKDAAKFSLDQIRSNFGDEAADAITLDHLQGAYIAMAGGKQGTDTKRAVIDVEDKAEVEAHTAQAYTPPVETGGESADTGQKETAHGNDQSQGDSPGVGQQDPQGSQRPAGERGASAQPGNAPSHPGAVEGEQPADVEAPGASQPDGRSGDGAAGSDVGSQKGPHGGRAPRNGRKGAGRAGNPDAGTRGSNPADLSPADTGPGDYVMADPLRVIGGGQVARFDKNKAAIDLRNRLVEDGRKPTAEEQEILAGYTGWGSFGQELFKGSWEHPEPKAGWEKRDQWLRDNLGQKEWEGMQRSIINAHFTDPPTIMAMWDMVKRMGFKGGRVLEPSIGSGNFYALMPPEMTGRSQRAGIELDPVTGSIAQLLYPNSNIQIKGYEESTTPDNFYDLVIGNWPFSEISPADRRYNRLSPTLHDYFFLKAIDQTRPGGIVIGITTKGTMDKKGVSARIEMARKAELVAAFRLPTGAFDEYAGTKVVTDIIILRKRAAPVGVVDKEGWIEVRDHDTPEGTKVPVNQYFHDHPDHVIGTINYGHGTTTFRPGLIVDRPADMMEQLRRIVELVPEGAFKEGQGVKHISYVANHTSDRTNALVKTADGLFIVRGEHLAPANEMLKFEVKDAAKTAQRRQQLEALIDMRKLYGQLIDAERTGDAEQQRTALRTAYEAFTTAHGPLSDSFALSYMERIDEPFYPALAALELPGGGKGKYRPAAILTKTTMRGSVSIESPTVSDAFVLARNQTVNPTPEQIAEIAKVTPEQAKRELIASGAAFELPNGDFAPADVYLSGNVREKMRQARAALESGNEAMRHNVAALEKVLPPTIPYYKIETQMGATWVPAAVYGDFVAHMLGMEDTTDADTRKARETIDVKFQAGAWKIDFDSDLNHRPEANSGFGSRHVRFKRLVRAAIANQSITVKYKDADNVEHVDDEATKEVNGKIADMRLKFGEWLWKDPTRKVQLEHEYNEVRNSYATPTFDGSFLSFQGMALSLGRGAFNLRQHQVNAIWRALVTRKSLNAHEVGTGKTFTMGGIAVESRRYGIAKKPVLFAHNANSKSVAAEIQMMYPSAKVLYVDNLSKDNVKVRMMQITNDDWDVVVLPHSLIDRIGFKEETLMGMAHEDLLELATSAQEAAAEDGVTITDAMWTDEEELKKLRSVTAKQLVKQRLKILTTIRKLAQQASREDAVAFEDMGVDMVLVDEAHEFKKPPFATKMKIKGLQTQTSDRSIAMMFMTRYVRAMNNGNNVHLFTGTPITNTMTEVFHVMRYLMQEEMKESALADWDGWFGSFAREVNDVELTSTGDYEAVVRLQSFINVPELRRMIGQYMDVVFSDDMPEMQPRMVDGHRLSDPGLTEAQLAKILNGRTENAEDRPYKKVLNQSSDMSPEQMTVFRQVQAWANTWRHMSKKDRKDAMATGRPESPIIHDGIAARASFDVRLVNAIANAGKEGSEEMTPHPDSKPARVIKNLLEIYRSDPNANQAVFMEQGLSKHVTRREGPPGAKRNVTYPAFSTVIDMVERLVQAGVPREQMAIVDGSTSKDRRKEVADSMNDGRIRIVFGSSDSLGVGVNMQRNLRAMHHVDAPWMPGELEQRNGRGHRQGNQWNTVLEYRYLTDRLDGRRWQVLAIKQKFITDFMKSKGEVRVIEGDAASEEPSDILSTFSEAAGDPRVLLRTKFQKKLEQLMSRERMHSQAMVDAEAEVARARKSIASFTKQLDEVKKAGTAAKAGEIVEATRGDLFSVKVDGETFTERQEAVEAIQRWAGANLQRGQHDVKVGELAGEPLYLTWPQFSAEPHLSMHLPGDVKVDTSSISFNSLERHLRGVRDDLEADFTKNIDKATRRMHHAEGVANEPFHLKGELAAARKRLEELIADLARNPVAPPYWLRSGAPIDTDVVWNGKPYTVSGHRWSADGWYVLAHAEGSKVVEIPYLEAKDSQGMPLYEERDFEPPTVQNSNGTPQPGMYWVTDDQGRRESSPRMLSAEDIKQILDHKWKIEPVVVPKNALLAGQIAKLDESDRLTLQAHFGTARGAGDFVDEVRQAVVDYVTRGVEAVASAVRSIIKAIAEGLMAVGLIFNPLQVQDFQPAQVQAVRQVLTDVQRGGAVSAEPAAAARAKMSDEAVEAYRALAPAAKAMDKGFMIADKANGLLHVFNADGSVLAQESALFGKDRGDVETGNSLVGGQKITPAGRFTLELTEDSEYAGGKLLKLAETRHDGGFIAVHAAYLGDPSERRLQRLASANPDDHRISYGCINTTHETFLKKILPVAEHFDGGMIVVLPDRAENVAAAIQGGPVFNQSGTGAGTATGRRVGELQAVADPIAEKLGVSVDVYASVASPSVPKAVRDEARARIARGGNVPSAVLYQGRVLIFADRTPNESHLVESVLHEVYGHLGLRGRFGAELDAILRQIAAARPAQVTAMMVKNGMKPEERLRAAEEILAEMAQKNPQLGFVRRAIAALRTFLRKLGLKIELTDDEITRSFLTPAREFFTGKTAPGAVVTEGVEFSGGQSPFYSALSKGIEAVPDKALSAIGWTGALNALVNKGKAKADEIEWSGVKDWLETQPGKITKESLLSFLSTNGVRVTESVKAERDLNDTIDNYIVELDALGYTVDRQAAVAGEMKVTNRASGYEVRVNDDGDVVDQADKQVIGHAADVIRNLGSAIYEGGDFIDDDIESTRYGTYTLPGGQNYREVLLTLPHAAPTDDQIRARLMRDYGYKRSELQDLSTTMREKVQDDLAGKTAYRSNHWNEPNILAHIRLNDRTDADGKRVLFVEEIQSDWAQEGKKKGFAGQNTTGWRAKEPSDPNGLWHVTDANGKFVLNVFAKSEADAIQRASSGGTPRAPFVENTDAWTRLALKRIVKMAVDEGYDRVAFVTGQQSADRYGLESNISSLRIVTKDKQGLDGAIFTAMPKGNSRAINRTISTQDELSELVGAEMAQKIIDAQPKKGTGGNAGGWIREVSGLDLKMGGEGMKAFYDKIVPAAANKLLKALGGEKMGSVRIWHDLENGGKATRQQPGFDITPEMRAAAADGLPLFNQSSTDPHDWFRSVTGIAREYTDTPGKLNWWHKTFGTPFNLAQRFPVYRKVYDRVQDFLNDVSRYATVAADLAPRILPKLEGFKGMFKSPLKAADNKAIARPIIDGTLRYTRDVHGKPVLVSEAMDSMSILDKGQMLLRMKAISPQVLQMWQGMQIEQYEAMVNASFAKHAPGIVWSDEELRTVHGLTADRIGLYREAMASANRSITDLVKADMLRYAGKDADPIRDTVLGAATLVEAGETARDYLMSLMDLYPDRRKVLADMADRVMAKANRGQRLIDKGYFPLSRFGTYTLDVVDADGERVYFGLFESRMERRQMQSKMEKLFPGSTIRAGTTSQEEHKLFAGMTPETAELFGELLGLEPEGEGAANVAFQEFIKRSKASRSAMKRLLERKGIEGFSEDIGRVLAGFVYSNSRQIAQSLHTKGIAEAAQQIPQGQGELKDAAVRLMRYVQEPQEEAIALRGVLFAQYLGGSIAAMLVNMTQPVQVTMPFLSQYGGIRQAAGMMKGAIGDVWKKTLEPGLHEALQRAVEDGTVAPQEIHQLMAQARGRGQLHGGDGTALGDAMAMGHNALAKVVHGWGQPFAVAELFNRRVTFIAAYRTAVKQGIANPAKFAANAVNQTQFVYNKGNKPELGRGAVGSLLFTFKQYGISYLELLQRMWASGPEGKKASLFMLAMLVLMGGAGGLPFEDDLLDLVDGIGQRLGYNMRSRHARQQFLEATLGKTFGNFVDKGVSGLPGVPVDVAARFGMGNMIPGTGLLMKKDDHTRDVTELLGPAGDMASRGFQAANLLTEGKPVQAGLAVAPKAASNWAKAAEMANLGYYTDAKGRKVIDVDGFDAAAKFIGFQPNAVARTQQATADVQQMVAMARMKESEIADRWAKGLFQHDIAAAQSAREEVTAWNRANPESPIRITPAQLNKRVRDMRKTKEERLAGAAPKEVRAEVLRELREK